ncbi:MAG: DUF1566 domain-containing protein [Phycisphaeraceae bacterium]
MTPLHANKSTSRQTSQPPTPHTHWLKAPDWYRALTAAVLIITAALSHTTQAALLDRGHGLIYDTSTGLTWLQDANYAQNSGYDADGKMHLAAARSFANNLVYKGIDDWHLPNTHPGSYELDLETLVEVSLLNHYHPQPDFQYTAPFQNMNAGTPYWSPGTGAWANQTWTYTYNNPHQSRIHYAGELGGDFIPWPVRHGDPLQHITSDFDSKLLGGDLNSLQGWDLTGRGSAQITQRHGRTMLQLTTGSPVNLSQHFDTPNEPFILTYDLDMSETWGQDLRVYLNNQLIDQIFNSTTGLTTRTLTIDSPTLLSLEATELRFTLDYHAPGYTAYLDNITVCPVPEPGTLAIFTLTLIPLNRLYSSVNPQQEKTP